MPTPSEIAAARGFIYRWLALAYNEPEPAVWDWLQSEDSRSALRHAMQSVVPALHETWARLGIALSREQLPASEFAYRSVFGHTVRGDCPPHEIEYGELKADPLFQPHRLADIAAFYRAFGVEIAADASDRPDFIAVEFEFMTVLATKEAYALENNLSEEKLAVVRDAQRDFLREHLARWTPAFTRRVTRLAPDGFLAVLGEFTREFIFAECARYGVTPGNEDLKLRPADMENETLCGSCGLNQALPGATPVPAES